jgi:hypothetical protein
VNFNRAQIYSSVRHKSKFNVLHDVNRLKFNVLHNIDNMLLSRPPNQ